MTDLYAVRRTKLRDAYRCDSVYDSLEDMLKKRNDLDATAIFSDAPSHVKHVKMCMEHGLHVVSAVPACTSLEDAEQLRDAATPEAELLGKQIAATVNRAMEQLPDDLRTAITLREIEGLSYEEIASVMNCPIGTVRSRIFRARESIAAELRPLLGTDENRRW